MAALGATGFTMDSGSNGFTASGYRNTEDYQAWGAQGGSQNIKVTVSEGDVTKEKTVGITVKALASTYWNVTDNAGEDGAKLTYCWS